VEVSVALVNVVEDLRERTRPRLGPILRRDPRASLFIADHASQQVSITVTAATRADRPQTSRNAA
jgi:hypothetical protein